MNRPDPRFEWMSLADFEEMLPDKPRDEKWELIGGRVIRMMVGARWEHHRVAANIDFALTDHFRRRGMPCLSYRETFWLKESRQDLAVFPDVMVRCGPPLPGETSLSDPSIVVEVMSPGSVVRDKIEKRSQYEKLPSVSDIVLVSFDPAYIEHTTRLDDGSWRMKRLKAASDVLALPAIDFAMPLTEVFRDVVSLPDAG